MLIKNENLKLKEENLKIKESLSNIKDNTNIEISKLKEKIENNNNNIDLSSINLLQENIFNEMEVGISVIFRYSSTNMPPILIQCFPNEKVSDVIKKFRLKSGNYSKSLKFIFNAIKLNQVLTVAEAGLTNNCNIFVKEDE